jgi:hypothetical protein
LRGINRKPTILRNADENFIWFTGFDLRWPSSDDALMKAA